MRAVGVVTRVDTAGPGLMGEAMLRDPAIVARHDTGAGRLQGNIPRKAPPTRTEPKDERHDAELGGEE